METLLKQQNISFVDVVYLKNFGLSSVNILDYFALSPFYDPMSNNEAIRTQGVNISHLVNMVGLEFASEKSSYEPSFFIIKKQIRLSPKTAEILAVYYVSIFLML